ncbi:unnamed protein product [Pedinophyceae sp. YPF-701]|nr:unnamed protein product [Pedinophyceae sp. YPF-701]
MAKGKAPSGKAGAAVKKANAFSLEHGAGGLSYAETIAILFGAFMLLIIGRMRDIFRKFLNLVLRGGQKSRVDAKGMAPLFSDFESFYTRRFYRRIQDCFNRPICSAPDGWTQVMLRKPTKAPSGETYMAPTKETKFCLNLASYNYLGFANQDAYCTPRVVETLMQYGASACSPSLEAGSTPVVRELETSTAEFLRKEAAVVFGMGFATNSTVLPTLCGKGSLVLSDSLNHLSIVAGLRSSGATTRIFQHNDAESLESILRWAIADGQPRTHRPWKNVLIVVEGIYSMEGETTFLREAVRIKKKYGAYLFLDEAHSIGAMGATGRGLCEAAGVDMEDVDILMGTYTKSFGSCGGYIAGDRDVIRGIRLSSPGTLAAASMAPAAAEQALSALKLIMGRDGTERGVRKIRRLHAMSNWCRVKMMDMGLDVLGDWDSAVIPIMIISGGKIPTFSRLMLERNVACVVVGFPATPLMGARARLCISAGHTLEDLRYAIQCIDEVTDLLMLKYRKASPLPVPERYRKQMPEWERLAAMEE